MSIRIIFFLVIISCFFLSCDNVIEHQPQDNTQIAILDSKITEEHYSVLLENRFSNVSVPLKLYYNGRELNANIEAQGAGSRYFPKWGYTITLDNNTRLFDLSSFNLTTQIYDKTKIRNTLASYIFKQLGFLVFKSTHCVFRINNNDKGLYVLVERIEPEFFADRLISVNELIKVTFGAKFTYNEKNDLKDNFEKKIPDDKNFSNLAEFINALDTAQIDDNLFLLEKYLDINNYLKYHAVSSLLNNSDGLTNNFYLYKEKPGSPYTIIPWDFDKTFDPQANIGIFGENAISRKLFRNDSCKSLYKSHLNYILNNIFTEDKLFPIIDSVAIKIRSAYNNDVYLGAGGIFLDNEINNLKSFITQRRLNFLSNVNDN